MPILLRRLVAVVAVVFVVLSGAPTGAAAAPAVYVPKGQEVALEGHDPVAYFTDGRAVMGDPGLTHRWNGATFRFATADHRDRFAADPERYAPQYGGYCAWAVAHGALASGDPRQWTIHDGNLYLNYNADIKARWTADIPRYVRQANEHWPEVLDR